MKHIVNNGATTCGTCAEGRTISSDNLSCPLTTNYAVTKITAKTCVSSGKTYTVDFQTTCLTYLSSADTYNCMAYNGP